MPEPVVATDEPQIDDSWSRWEYPTLRALARWEEDNSSRQMISRNDVVGLVAPPPEDAWRVGRALHRLHKAGYIEIVDAMDGTPWPSVVMGLTPSGWRRAGVWPSPESFQRDFIARLTSAADQISIDQPAKASKVRDAAEVLTGAASDIFAKVAAELLAKAAGL
jgi:hypothetical protein